MQSIKRPAPTIPVAAEADVLIVGGGPTGIGAALAAAGEGARVVLVERHGMLGGMWTAGLVNPVFDSEKGWLVDTLVQNLKDAGAWKTIGMNVFDAEIMQYTLERMLASAGIDFWFHALGTEAIVEDRRILGVTVQSKSGAEAILSTTVIDGTGDGDIAAAAGVPFQKGRERDGLMQPMTLMFEISGIEGLGDIPLAALNVHEIYDLLQTSIAEHNLSIQMPYGAQRSGTPYFISLPSKGTAAIQATNVCKMDATNVRDVTRATVEARRQIHEIFMPVLRRIPGLQNIRLTRSGVAIGIRESRHMEGRYRLELSDLLEHRRFDDAITAIGFHLDTHEIDPDNPNDPKLPDFPPGVTRHNIGPCEIPYRCLLPKNIEGLLFAGRCISGAHHVHSAYRVTGTCMAMGQAAGLAAAMAAAHDIPPGALDGAALKTALQSRGVRFLKAP